MLLVDGGVEKFNSAVDKVVESGLLRRVLALTEIRFSNSLNESWWRVLKHRWLYLNTLDTVTTAVAVDSMRTRGECARAGRSGTIAQLVGLRRRHTDQSELGGGDGTERGN